MTCIRFRNVVVFRSGRAILNVPDLSVEEGQFLGVVGPNGAGKSTFLDLCAGMTLPQQGEVEIFGRKISFATAWERSQLRCRIGYLPQMPPFNPDLPFTVKEVLEGGRAGRRGLLRRLSAQDRLAVREWMERLNLMPLADRTFRTLSGGEQRKALIARAMVQEPDLLLLDEPTANLDMDWRERVVAFIDDIYRSARMSVVMVCHETGLLPAGCGTVALIAGGSFMKIGPPEVVFTSENLSRLFGCPVEVVRLGSRYHAASLGFPAAGGEG